LVQTKIKNIIILGSSGGCLDILGLIDDINKKSKRYNFLGFLEDNLRKTDKKFKKFILGSFSDIKKFKNAYFATAIGNETNFTNKEKIFKKLNIKKNRLITLIHPSVIIEDNVKIGFGSIIHNGTYIGRNSEIGDNVVILPKNIISHDCRIKDFTTINSGCILSGNVKIYNNCYIGAGVNIRDHVNINRNILLGMGSIVLNDLKTKSSVYFGNPAKYIKKIKI